MPAYMVPSVIELRDGPLPRNPNGKIDRKTLSTEFEQTHKVAPMNMNTREKPAHAPMDQFPSAGRELLVGGIPSSAWSTGSARPLSTPTTASS
jgi:hypothetical protein